MTEPEIRNASAESAEVVLPMGNIGGEKGVHTMDTVGGEVSLMALLAADPANALEKLAPGVYLARIAEDNRWSVSGF